MKTVEMFLVEQIANLSLHHAKARAENERLTEALKIASEQLLTIKNNAPQVASARQKKDA